MQRAPSHDPSTSPAEGRRRPGARLSNGFLNVNLYSAARGASNVPTNSSFPGPSPPVDNSFATREKRHSACDARAHQQAPRDCPIRLTARPRSPASVAHAPGAAPPDRAPLRTPPRCGSTLLEYSSFGSLCRANLPFPRSRRQAFRFRPPPCPRTTGSVPCEASARSPIIHASQYGASCRELLAAWGDRPEYPCI